MSNSERNEYIQKWQMLWLPKLKGRNTYSENKPSGPFECVLERDPVRSSPDFFPLLEYFLFA